MARIKASILVVDDEVGIRHAVRDILEDEGFDVIVANGAMQARAARLERRPDIVLLDIWMPGTDGISLLKEWSQDPDSSSSFEVIMMSGHGTIETAVEATRLGAYDFLEKPLSMAKMLLTIERALQTQKLKRENRAMVSQALAVYEPIGSSHIMSQLREQAAAIARHDAPILFYSEPGCGKEACARYVHELSDRKEAPFVTLRIRAIASENSEVAIFGHEQSGQAYYGHLEQAHGGTLFLDEVSDLDLDTQGRLLSALQQSAFLRVDGAQPVKIDVRIIASTRHDLRESVRQGNFRDDLFYFLNVLPVSLPALRDRVDDINEIVRFYSDYFAQQENFPHRSFSDEALDSLCQYDWPGNDRELKNLVQRLLILGNGSMVEACHIEDALGKLPKRVNQPAIERRVMDLPLRDAREAFERDYLLYQWQQCGGSMSKLSKKVGMERTHLYRKLKSLQIDHQKPAAKS